MGGPAKKAAEFSAKTWFLPTAAPYWAYKGGQLADKHLLDGKIAGKADEYFGDPKVPKPAAAPPPVDKTEAFFREISRQRTQRELNTSRGRTAAMGSEPYRAPGSKTTTGG